MKNRALAAIKAILLSELDLVTSTLLEGLDEPDELHEHWLPRLKEVNMGLQFLDKLDGLRVVHMDERQYQTMRTLLAFHQGNDDFGDDPKDWPYDETSLDTLCTRLDNIEKHGL